MIVRGGQKAEKAGRGDVRRRLRAVVAGLALVAPFVPVAPLAAADRLAGLTVLDLVRDAPRRTAGNPARDGLVAIPVPAVTIYPGQVITADMLEERRLPAAALRRMWLADPRRAVGRMAGRTLVRGRPIPRAALQAPWVVRRNQTVRLVFTAGALRITALGRALDNAAAGEPVAVRNVDSGRVVHGVAGADGSVRVGVR